MMAASTQRRVPFTFLLTRVKCGLATQRMAVRLRERMIEAGVKMTVKTERTLDSIGRLGGTEAEAQYLWDLSKKVSAAQARARRRQSQAAAKAS